MGVVPVIVGIIFVIVIGSIIRKAVHEGHKYAQNSAAPVQTFAARVVTKRTHVTSTSSDTPTSTSYHVTFERTDGHRLEFGVAQEDYGQLVEGDEGQLTHQGTWFRGFERRRVISDDPFWEAPGGPSVTPPTQ